MMVKQTGGRRSIRLEGYDYCQAGAYFVTVCTFERKILLGRVRGGNVMLTPLGAKVRRSLEKIPQHFDHVQLDERIIMPNHLHMILIFGRGTIYRAPTEEGFGKPVAGSLATVIRTFKASVTREWRRIKDDAEFKIWQRNYYERVIRDERALNTLRRYIRQNPRRWRRDRYFRP